MQETQPSRGGARYHLRTLGTVGLSGPGTREVLGAHGHHRRRLALLSLLAAAGEQGRSRDQLLALFWPESTEARARHSLDQLLYAIRSSVGEDVFTGVNPVRLNTAVLTTDVGVFNASLERGDVARAAAEYRGPFLDGFHLDDSLEFERWVEVERASLASRHSAALEKLAEIAAVTGDHRLAVEWWRTLSYAEPLSDRNAAGLGRALMLAGDRAAALQCLHRHEVVLARELGVGAGTEVAELIAELRQRPRADDVLSTRTTPSTTSVLPRVRSAEDTAALPGAAHETAVVGVSMHASSEVGAAAMTDMASPPTVVRPISAAKPRVRRALYALGIPAVLAAVIAVVVHSHARHADKFTPPGARALVVLPMANISGAPQDGPFVDGLSEELIAVLSRVPGIRVIARTSSFAFRNSGLDVRRIADSLGVSYVLEGGVQRAGSRLHVQVRLVDARDGVTRWSETYDRELRDVFAVQADIASGVAHALALQLGSATLARAQRGGTSNVAAYELYLRGNDPSLTRSDSTARAALGYFEQAIALDPRYAAAYAGSARMHMRLANTRDTTMSRQERLRRGKAAALTAVALDDSLADGHAALSAVKRNEYDFPATATELMRAVALEPQSARFHEWLVQLYVWTLRPAEALAEARRAVELDPLSPTANAELAHALLANGRCDEALARLAPLRSLRPPLLRAANVAAKCYAAKGMWPEAIAEAERNAAAAGPTGDALLGFLLARARRTAESRRILGALLEQGRRRGDFSAEVAMVYAGLGEKENAWAYLEEARAKRTLVLDDLSLVLGQLRPDPRVDRFLREVGLQNR